MIAGDCSLGPAWLTLWLDRGHAGSLVNRLLLARIQWGWFA